jgi:hypothetical protein
VTRSARGTAADHRPGSDRRLPTDDTDLHSHAAPDTPGVGRTDTTTDADTTMTSTTTTTETHHATTTTHRTRHPADWGTDLDSGGAPDAA